MPTSFNEHVMTGTEMQSANLENEILNLKIETRWSRKACVYVGNYSACSSDLVLREGGGVSEGWKGERG
jgi:hypothetical protein